MTRSRIPALRNARLIALRKGFIRVITPIGLFPGAPGGESNCHCQGKPSAE